MGMVPLNPMLPRVLVHCTPFGVPMVMVLVMPVARGAMLGAFWVRGQWTTDAPIGQA